MVVPFGNQKIEGYVIEVKDSSAYPVERIKPILSVLDELPAITEEGLSLMRFMQKRYFAPAASVLRLFLPAEMRQGKIREQISRYYVLKEGDYAQMEASLRSTAVKQRAALAYLKENGRVRAPLLNEKFGREAILGLYGKGLIEVLSERENRSPYRDISSEDKPVRLTARQPGSCERNRKHGENGRSAARRHRQRKDGGLPEFDPKRHRARKNRRLPGAGKSLSRRRCCGSCARVSAIPLRSCTAV